MKSAFVVLALSGLAKAEPEADPQLLLNAAVPSAFTALPRFASFAPSVVSQSPLIYNAARPVVYANPAPVAIPAPIPRPVVYANPTPAFIPAPAPVAKTVVAPVPSVRINHPHECASPEGCAVRALIDHGLAKRDAESEPEADPQFLGAPFIGAAPYAVGAAPYAFSNGLYNNNLYGLNNLAYAAGSPYFAGYNPALPAPGPLAVQAAPAVVREVVQAPLAVQQVQAPLPVLRQAVVAAPAPVVAAAPAPVVTKTVAPLPVLRQTVVAAAPAPVLRQTVVAAAPAPVVAVRKPFVKPVVASRTKKVTYTHLGAHPLTNPATVLETESKVIGHQVY